MVLTNFWLLLIWLFLGGAIFNKLPKRSERVLNKSMVCWQPIYAILMVLPYAIWAGFRENFGDTYVYIQGYQNAVGDISLIPSLFFSGAKDPGYGAFLIIMKSILGNQVHTYFLIISLFQILCLAFVFRKYSINYFACIFLFVVSTDYLSWMHNGMRQFIAVAIIFAGFKYLLEKRYIPMICLVLLASLFHGSAIIMLPIIFIVQGEVWNKKSVLFIILTAIVIVFIDQFTPILEELLQETQYDDVMTGEIWSTDDGTNIIRVLVYSVPALLSIIGFKQIRNENDPVLNICSNCSIITMALYAVSAVTSGIYIGRLPIYTTLYGYMALPKMLEVIFEEKSKTLVKYLMYFAYLCFFYFQMAVEWNAL